MVSLSRRSRGALFQVLKSLPSKTEMNEGLKEYFSGLLGA